jgi:outer membrane protein TolC
MRSAFRVLAGLDPPPTFAERNTPTATPAGHPRIVLRHSALRKAYAEQDLTWIMDRERPEFGGFVENMNDTSAEPNVTTLGVRLKIPFAYDPVNQPKRAAAAAEVVAAAEELALAEREVAGGVDQAQVRLDGARQQLAALEARRGNLATVVQLARDGQRAGQVALSELIRARLQLYEADLARATARVAVERARSDRNQALGLEP